MPLGPLLLCQLACEHHGLLQGGSWALGLGEPDLAEVLVVEAAEGEEVGWLDGASGLLPGLAGALVVVLVGALGAALAGALAGGCCRSVALEEAAAGSAGAGGAARSVASPSWARACMVR